MCPLQGYNELKKKILQGASHTKNKFIESKNKTRLHYRGISLFIFFFLDFKEGLQRYLHLSLSKDTSGARTQDFSD
jgi:hypothetical protein